MREEVMIGIVILAIIVFIMVANDIANIVKSRHDDEDIDIENEK